MSWDADLCCDACGTSLIEQNYTHNTNGMANGAPVVTGEQGPWYQQLDGMSGPEGARFLDGIIRHMEAHPELRDQNPNNGWGDYDRFLSVLKKMRDRTPEAPATWRTCG